VKRKNSSHAKQECTKVESAARRAQCTADEAARAADEAEEESKSAASKESLAKIVLGKCRQGGFREQERYKREHTEAYDAALEKRQYFEAKAYLSAGKREEAAALTRTATHSREQLQRQIVEGQAAEGGIQAAGEFLKGSSRVDRHCRDRSEVYSGAFLRSSQGDKLLAGSLPVSWELFFQLMQCPKAGAAKAIQAKLKDVLLREEDSFQIELMTAARLETIAKLKSGSREENKNAMARLTGEQDALVGPSGVAMDPASPEWGARFRRRREGASYSGPSTEVADLESAYSTLRRDLDYHTLSENATAARLPMHESEGGAGSSSSGARGGGEALSLPAWVGDHTAQWSLTLQPGRWQAGMRDQQDWAPGGALLAARGEEPEPVGKPWARSPSNCREQLVVKQGEREGALDAVDAWDSGTGARSPRAAPKVLRLPEEHRWATEHEREGLALNRFPMTIK